MINEICNIVSNEKLCSGIYRIVLGTEKIHDIEPGQFLNLKIGNRFLRRPLSVSDYEDGKISIVYEVVGGGTAELAELSDGWIDVLGPLGNGFDLKDIPENSVLVGGGLGIAPIYYLSKRLKVHHSVVLGYRNEEKIYLEDEFRQLEREGRLDLKVKVGGYVTDILDRPLYACGCGPEPMLLSLNEKAVDGQYSLESRMACGFGACMGCTCKTKDGYVRICCDGPVVKKEAIAW